MRTLPPCLVAVVLILSACATPPAAPPDAARSDALLVAADAAVEQRDACVAEGFRVGCPCSSHRSIAAALADAPEGARIEICAGLYRENVTISRSVELIGVDGADETTIADPRGDALANVVSARGMDRLVVRGLTFVGARNVGLSIESVREVTVEDCRFVGNSVGLSVASSTATMSNLELDGTDVVPRGPEDHGVHLFETNATIDGLWVHGYSITSTALGVPAEVAGVGMTAYGGVLDLRNLLIEDQSVQITTPLDFAPVAITGVGLRIWGARARLTDCQIRNNSVTRAPRSAYFTYGVGLYVENAALEMTRCTIEGNTVVDEDVDAGTTYGVGVFLMQDDDFDPYDARLVDTVIQNNRMTGTSAWHSGGAGIGTNLHGLVRVEGGAIVSNGIVTLDPAAPANPSAAIVLLGLSSGVDVEGTDLGDGVSDNIPGDVGVKRDASSFPTPAEPYGAGATFYCSSSAGCAPSCTAGCRSGARCESGASCGSGICTSGRCD